MAWPKGQKRIRPTTKEMPVAAPVKEDDLLGVLPDTKVAPMDLPPAVQRAISQGYDYLGHDDDGFYFTRRTGGAYFMRPNEMEPHFSCIRFSANFLAGLRK